MDPDVRLVRIRRYIETMPALPVTVGKVLEVCNNPKASPVDLNRVISVDPVLMARVMRLINSAYYGLSGKVTSLVRAIIMLGLNTVKNLALSTAVMENLGRGENFRALHAQGFWRHSLAVGVASKLIATQRNVASKELEEYFIAGLLHDIGKIPINAVFEDEFLEVMAHSDRERTPLFVTERELLGLDHASVGRLIAKTWKLSPEVIDAISSHHEALEYEGDHKDLVYTVVLANHFANIAELGFSGDRYPAPLPETVPDHLGVDIAYLDGIEQTIHSEIEKAAVFLRIAEVNA